MLLNRVKTGMIVVLIVICAGMVFKIKLLIASAEGAKQEVATLSLQLSTVESIKNSQSKQIAQLVQERKTLSSLLSARTESLHRDKAKLSADIQTLKKALSTNTCFDTRYPKSVIKRLHLSY